MRPTLFHCLVRLLLALCLATLWASVLWINRQSETRGLEDMRRETAALALLFATHADMTFRTIDLALNDLRAAADRPADEIARVIEPHQALLSQAILQTGIVNALGITGNTPAPQQRLHQRAVLGVC